MQMAKMIVAGATVGIAAAGWGATVQFEIDVKASSATINAAADVPGVGGDTDSDTSALTGIVTAEVTPSGEPFGGIQITDLSVMFADGLDFTFCLFPVGPACLGGADVSAGPNDLEVFIVTPGAETTVAANAFTQLGNDIGSVGVVTVDGTGLADGQIPEGAAIVDESGFIEDISGTIVEDGDELVVTLPLDLALTLTEETGLYTIDLEITGTVVARGAAPACPADCSPPGGNGLINIDDLLAVINAFSTGDLACDVSPDNGDGTFGNGAINIDDLLAVIAAFGPCP